MTINSRDHMRTNMIEHQIRSWNVLNQYVLNAFDAVSRDEFVDEEFKTLAFTEMRLPLKGHDRMLFPALEGRILQEVGIKPLDSVLVIGSGTGFLATLAAQLGEQVTAIDLNADYTNKAQKIAEKLQVHNVTFVTADLSDFAVEQESYDVIVMTGSLKEVPQKLLEGLKLSGRLLAFVGKQDQPISSGVLFQNELGEIREESIFEVELERLIGFEDQPQFVF